MKGIDVSLWQGDINWKSVYNDGVRFAMIKATQGKNIVDPQFANNIVGAYSAGVACGTYHYLSATTVNGAIEEAEFFAKTMEPYRDCITLWSAIDVEERKHQDLDNSTLTDIVIAFCETVKTLGYEPMLYANGNFISYHYEFDRLRKYPLWYACWYDAETENDKPIRDYDYKIWQHGVGRVNGIGGDVDADFGYFDLPEAEPVVEGDIVKVKPGAYYYGTSIEVPEFVLEKDWIVSSVSGDRVVIDASTDGLAQINSAVYQKDCIILGNVDPEPQPEPEPEPNPEPEPEPNPEPDPEPQPEPPTEEDPKEPEPSEPSEPSEDDDTPPALVNFFKMILRALLIAVRSVFGKGADK